MTLQKNEETFLQIVGLFFAYLAPIDEISSIEDKTTDSVSVDFVNPYDWKEIYFTKDTGSFVEKMKRVDQGKIYQQELNVSFPGKSLQNQILISDLTDKPIIIKLVVTSCIGELPFELLIGTKENPVFLDTDSNIENFSGSYVFSVKRDSPVPAPYII